MTFIVSIQMSVDGRRKRATAPEGLAPCANGRAPTGQSSHTSRGQHGVHVHAQRQFKIIDKRARSDADLFCCKLHSLSNSGIGIVHRAHRCLTSCPIMMFQ